MLWEIVYDFFVQSVFGGVTSTGEPYTNYIGVAWGEDDYDSFALTNVQGFSLTRFDGSTLSLPFGSYLSLIATIITMVVILLFCVFIVKKIIGIIFRLFTGSSAF